MTELVTSGSVGGMASNGRLYPETALYHIKQLIFREIRVLLSLTIGVTTLRLPVYAPEVAWRRYSVALASYSALEVHPMTLRRLRSFACLVAGLLTIACGRGPSEMTSSNETIGMATMRQDKTIVLTLRAEGPGGTIGDAQFEYRPGDPEYDEILRHVGPLKAGEQEFVQPWPDN